MRMVERHRLGMCPLEHQIHMQAEVVVVVVVEMHGVVEVEVGAAITGEVRHLEGQMTLPAIGKQTLG